MTREEVVRLAREAGFRTGHTDMATGDDQFRFVEPCGTSCLVELENFAALVAAHERKACAKVCDAKELEYMGREMKGYWQLPAALIAIAIRARGQQ